VDTELMIITMFVLVIIHPKFIYIIPDAYRFILNFQFPIIRR
jgi:hypothetical protein